MIFANPSYLWALFGLIIPLAIHLWNNRKGRIIKVGSTAFLQESDSAQSNSLNLNEFWLLFLRMLLLTLLVFIMAEPRFITSKTNVPITYLIEQSLLKNNEIRRIIRELPKNHEIRLLRTGLPEVDRQEIGEVMNLNDDANNYWQLLHEMQSLDTDSLVIFTGAYLSGLKGKRPTTNILASWIDIEPDDGLSRTLNVSKSPNNYEILKLEKKHGNLIFNKEILQAGSSGVELNGKQDSIRIKDSNMLTWMPIELPKEFNVIINYDEGFGDQLIYFEAAFNSISKYLDRAILVEKRTGYNAEVLENFDLLINLSDEGPEEKIDIKSLIFLPDELSSNLIVKGSNKGEHYLTERLNSENITEHHFSERLIEIMDFNSHLLNRLEELDTRVVALEEIRPNVIAKSKVKSKLNTTDVLPWILILFGITIVSERIISRLRKQ